MSGTPLQPDLVQLNFEVCRDGHSQSRVLESERSRPQAGEAVFAIERFAFSANNITYALLGERAGYWKLFPTTDGWGRIPVWGYLRVLVSERDGIQQGRRAFGLCPMSTHVVMRPQRLSSAGFVDASEHRAKLPPVYNAYAWLDGELAPVPELEDHLLVLRPLFWLSFMLDDLLAEEGLTHEHRVLVSSASSKASIGTAYLLARRGIEVIGLTSPANVDFVADLGLYDRVVPYDAVAKEPVAPSVLLDIAGSGSVRTGVERRLGAELARTVVAGFTHLDASGDLQTDGGRTSFLSGPDRMQRRAGELGWTELSRRYEDALHEFANSAERWLKITRRRGPAEVEAAYLETLNNAARADNAFVLTLAAQSTTADAVQT